ncbi:MAG: DivIVA domain-containing protein [Mycoplasmoidaceae bacterium]|nr:DivIVA domain-containing protein [Mycoplasmoidaceae bacterium]
MNEKILNKKFKKAVFSGYDANDVDSFFDTVITYLENNDKMLESHKANMAKQEKLIAELQTKVAELQNENNKLSLTVKTYEDEGYGKNWLKPNNQN